MRHDQRTTVTKSTLASCGWAFLILTMMLSIGSSSSSAEEMFRRKPNPKPPTNVPQNFVLTKTVVYPPPTSGPSIGTSYRSWNQLDLSWSPVTNAIGYELECTSDSSHPLGTSHSTGIFKVTPTSYRRTGAHDGYWHLKYRVRSVMKDGTKSDWSVMRSVNMN